MADRVISATRDADAAPRPWWGTPRGRVALRLLPAVLAFAAWEAAAGVLGSILIPGASATVGALARLAVSGETWSAFLNSNLTLVLGYAATVVLGVPLGLLMGRLRTLERVLDVWLDVLMVLPMAAVIPLVIMSLGLGRGAQIVVVVSFGLPMLAINCRAGVREVPPELIDMARCFGSTELQLWRLVLIPSASPAIWAGLRIAMGRAILGMVLVELLMTALGVGQLLQFYRARLMAPELYAVVALLVAESILLISAMRAMERRALGRRADPGEEGQP